MRDEQRLRWLREATARGGQQREATWTTMATMQGGGGDDDGGARGRQTRRERERVG